MEKKNKKGKENASLQYRIYIVELLLKIGNEYSLKRILRLAEYLYVYEEK